MGLAERQLVYRISVEGQSEGIATLRTFAQTAQTIANQEAASARSAARARTTARKEGLDAETKAEERAAKQWERIAADATKKQAAEAKKRAREAEAAERTKTKAAEREEAAREKAAEQAGRRIVQAMDKEIREFEKAERTKTRIAEQEQKKREREAERAQRTAIARAERESRRFYGGIGSAFGRGVSNAYSTVGSVAGRGAMQVARGLGLGGALDIHDVVQETMMVKAKLRQIAIENRGVGEEVDTNKYITGGYQKIKAAASATGISQTELVGALDVYSEKGLGGVGLENIERVAKESKAMGVDPATIAKIRAQMQISAEQAGQNLSEEQIQENIAKIAFLGKHGVFRGGDIAKQSEGLFSRFAASGGDFVNGFDKFIGFAEIARSATKSSSQANTAIRQVQDAILKKEGNINALGIKTRDQAGNERDFLEVMMDVVEKTGGKVGKAGPTGIFDVKAMSAINPFLSAFMAAGGAKDRKAGRAAMEQLLQKAQVDFTKGGGATAELNKDIGIALEDDSVKMAKAVQDIRQSLAETLAPALQQFSKMMPDIVKGLQGALGFMGAHPGLATALLGGAAFTKGFAGGVAPGMLATIGSTLFRTLGGSVGGATGTALQGAGSVVGAAGATPVFVVNWPGSGMPGGGGGAPAPGGGGGAVAVVAAGVAGYEVGKVIAPAVFNGTGINDEIDKESGLKSNANETAPKWYQANKALSKGFGKTFATLGQVYEGLFGDSVSDRAVGGGSWLQDKSNNAQNFGGFGARLGQAMGGAAGAGAGQQSISTTAEALSRVKERADTLTESMAALHDVIERIGGPGGSASKIKPTPGG